MVHRVPLGIVSHIFSHLLYKSALTKHGISTHLHPLILWQVKWLVHAGVFTYSAWLHLFVCTDWQWLMSLWSCVCALIAWHRPSQHEAWTVNLCRGFMVYGLDIQGIIHWKRKMRNLLSDMHWSPETFQRAFISHHRCPSRLFRTFSSTCLPCDTL